MSLIYRRIKLLRLACVLSLFSLLISGFAKGASFEGEEVATGLKEQQTVDGYLFENLGMPVPPQGPQPLFMTTDAEGRNQYWSYRRAFRPGDPYKIFGVDIESGEVTTLDLSEHVADTAAHICAFPYQDKYLYIWAGRRPGQFFKYDIANEELKPIGDGFPDMEYVLGYAIEGTNRMFIGGYPSTRLVSIEFGTDEIKDWGKLSEDENQKYILNPVVGKDGVLYAPVGLHHRAIYAINLRSGEKRQILSEGLMHKGGRSFLWVGSDGTVWGKAGRRVIRCREDGIDIINKEKEPGYEEMTSVLWQLRAPWPYRDGDPFRAGDWRVEEIGSSRTDLANLPCSAAKDIGETQPDELKLKHRETGEERIIKLDRSIAAGGIIFAVCDKHDGRVYGGMVAPANTFSYDQKENVFRYYPQYFGGGGIQVYNIISLGERGVLQSSYGGASLDWFDPSAPLKDGVNPQRVAQLSGRYGQERIQLMSHGPEGNVYFGTIPIKGQLGGALGRYQPHDHGIKVWRNVLPEQSVLDTASVPETGEVFAAGSTQGGSGSIPSKQEAEVFLWNCGEESISWTGKPVPGAADYLRAVLAPNGYIVGLARILAEREIYYYVFDPKDRKVVHSGVLPVQRVNFPYLCGNPLPTGEIIGVGDSTVYSIDAETGQVRIIVRHESLGRMRGMEYHSGYLYYGSGSNIWRLQLNDPDNQ